jgi:putative membrane protein
MKRAAIAFLIVGTALAAVLIARSEYGDIIHAFRTLGVAGFGALVGVHLALIALMGISWSVLGTPPRGAFVWARLVRDGAAEVLPLSQIGGFVLGARALVLAGAAPAFASASTVVDVTLELVAQLFYTLLGLGLLAWLRPGSAIEAPAIAAVAAMAVLASLFVLAQRRGAGAVERLLTKLSGALLGPRPPGGVSLSVAIATIHRRPKRLVAGIALHLLAWLLVGGETWLILSFIDARVGLAAAIVIDSLLSGLRSMAFMVPQALGVQEGAYVLLGAIFGVAPEAALAMSLIRRARDLAIGAPALIAWQVIEGRRVYRAG